MIYDISTVVVKQLEWPTMLVRLILVCLRMGQVVTSTPGQS